MKKFLINFFNVRINVEELLKETDTWTYFNSVVVIPDEKMPFKVCFYSFVSLCSLIASIVLFFFTVTGKIDFFACVITSAIVNIVLYLIAYVTISNWVGTTKKCAEVYAESHRQSKIANENWEKKQKEKRAKEIKEYIDIITKECDTKNVEIIIKKGE